MQCKPLNPKDIILGSNVRSPIDPNSPQQRELTASIKAHGILLPLLVMLSGVLLAGHRRLAAALVLGLESVPVIVTDRLLTDTEIRLIQLAENMQRADLSGFEKWTACSELMQMNPDWQLKELAAHLHLDPSMVTRILSPSRCIEAAKIALREGDLTISDCYAISKLPEDEQLGLLAMKLSGANRETLEKQVRKQRTVQATMVKLSKIVCPLAGGSKVVVSGSELSLEDLIEALGQALELAKKSSKEQLDVKTAQAVWRDRAKVGT